LPHEPIEQILPDIFLVHGSARVAPAMGLNRNMIIARDGDALYIALCAATAFISCRTSRDRGEEKTGEYLAKTGFSSIEKHELAHDIQNNWYVVRK